MALTIFIISSLVVALATATDLYGRRIPNRLTLPAAVAGLALHTGADGGLGLGSSLAGLLVGSASFLPFYLRGGLGAGDLKLLGAVGALLGLRQTYHALIAIALFGGAWALLWGLWRRYQRLAPAPLPYAPAIALGTLFSFWRTL